MLHPRGAECRECGKRRGGGLKDEHHVQTIEQHLVDLAAKGYHGFTIFVAPDKPRPYTLTALDKHGILSATGKTLALAAGLLAAKAGKERERNGQAVRGER